MSDLQQSLIYRQLSPEEFQLAQKLYQACVRDMHQRGIDQWDSYYPSMQRILLDIASASLYGAFKGTELRGLIVLNEKQDEAYSGLEWNIDTEEVLVVHRLAVHPDFQRTGLGVELMKFAERKAQLGGYGAIRLDGFSDNSALHDFYLGLGYSYVGDINLPMREPPYRCYEKQID